MTVTVPWRTTDPLTGALYDVRLRGAFYCWAEAAGPCAIDMPRLPQTLSFHVITRGEVWLEPEDGEPVLLRAGDVALVPRGLGHRLSTAPGTRVLGRADELPQTMLGDHLSVLRVGEGETSAAMLCGVVELDAPQAQELLGVLPPVVRTASQASSTMRQLIGLLASELREPRPGGETVATRLADVLVVESVRSWLADDGERAGGWLAALRDPEVGRVLAAVHREPGRPWTLEGLAALATMSRSAFAARFTALLGVPAMRYVTELRMRAAHRRLASGEGVTAVATSLGYGSGAAFSRAFARTTGVTPGSARRGG